MLVKNGLINIKENCTVINGERSVIAKCQDCKNTHGEGKAVSWDFGKDVVV
jgi:hypothetical protein